MKEHSNGRGSKYVRSRLPFELKYVETHPTRSSAMKREYEIKKFTKNRKLDLIKRYLYAD